MKSVKIAAIALVAYVGVVVAFETFLGLFQPSSTSTIVITTTGADGVAQDRVVSPIEYEGKLYVSANHWPRSWYKRALANPKVDITVEGSRSAYTAVPVTVEEHDRLSTERAHSIGFRILTGFPPRYFLRLDPR